jgi:hypothetical protein
LQINKVNPVAALAAPVEEALLQVTPARLSVVFDSKNMFGKMIKDIIINSSDPDKPKLD